MIAFSILEEVWVGFCDEIGFGEREMRIHDDGDVDLSVVYGYCVTFKTLTERVLREMLPVFNPREIGRREGEAARNEINRELRRAREARDERKDKEPPLQPLPTLTPRS